MTKQLLAIAATAFMAALLTPGEVDAYGAAHVGYTHVGPNGVYHVGETAVGGAGYGGARYGEVRTGYGYGGAAEVRTGYGYGGAAVGGARVYSPSYGAAGYGYVR